jgi:hypothetical protein
MSLVISVPFGSILAAGRLAFSCSYCRIKQRLPVDDAPEPFVVGVVVAPDDVAADHAGLLFMVCVVGTVQREVAQGRELCLDAV